MVRQSKSEQNHICSGKDAEKEISEALRGYSMAKSSQKVTDEDKDNLNRIFKGLASYTSDEADSEVRGTKDTLQSLEKGELSNNANHESCESNVPSEDP